MWAIIGWWGNNAILMFGWL